MFATRATTAVLALAAAAAVPAGPVTQPVTPRTTPVVAARAADVESPVRKPAVRKHTHTHADGSTHVHASTAVRAAAKPKPAPREAQAPVRPSTVRPEAAPGAMFRTVEAAMRYLASAYNRRDLAAMKHVTTPEARQQLEDMRPIAPELRLKSCTWGHDGYYGCTFAHTYPKGENGLGEAWVSVAPAAKPGWYMTVVEGCG